MDAVLDFLRGHAPYLLGGAAAAAALWGQARNFVGYLSSFLVVRAQMQYRVAVAVALHLRRDYRRLPSGFHLFDSLVLQVSGSSIFRTVPFRLPPHTCLYFGRRGVFLALDFDHLVGLRFVSDLTGLVSDAVEFYDELSSSGTTHALRAVKLMGSMGDVYAQMGKAFAEERSANNGREPVASEYAPDLRVDRSFKYADLTSGASFVDPFRGLFYAAAGRELIDDGDRWFRSQAWYVERGIPWRRGWLLHGDGGTGKSSMAKAIAQRLGLTLYQFYLSTMNDREFVREWEGMSVPCVALFEDFDNVFDGREPQTQHKSLSFDCILNQIQGVGSISGVLLIVTTNRLERIDPALGRPDGGGSSSRPGRIDRIVHFGVTDAETRWAIARHVLPDRPEEHRELVAAGDGMTPAQFQHACIERALGDAPIGLREAAD